MNPVYDAAYYEDLAGRLYGLVSRLGDRLSGDEAQWLHHVTKVGEYGLALDAWPRSSPTAKLPSPTRSVATYCAWLSE